MDKIKILVACHKPAELPENELFLPIQVGAKNASKRMKMQQDDEGENISAKNPTYCELTAQYWAWKNLEADYYGLCHYRRFLCFNAPSQAKRNYRDQIEASVMNSYNIERFGLNDVDAMRKIITENDAVVGEEQTVSRLYTPRGAKSTAYEHWVAHDRALVMHKDLDLMLDILSEVSPEVGAAAREYLNGKTFLGFNCFVMKKELFDQLCEIEFKTLEKLEEKVDLSHYCQQLTRIYGFMGEIISSSFIYYLQQTGKYKIKRVPLVYFNYTEPLENFTPLYPLDDEHVPLIFDYADSDPLRFGPVWQTFLEHIDEKVQYDVLAIADFTDYMQKILLQMAAEFKNVSLRFVPALPIRELLMDKYGFQETEREVMLRKKNPENDDWHFSILPYLPFVLTSYDKALVVDKNTLFCDDIAKMWRAYRNSESMIVAPRNAFIVSRVNDVYYETLARHLDQVMYDPYNYFSTNAFIWDFAAYREKQKATSIKKFYTIPDEPKQIRSKEEILNILCEKSVEHCDLRWGTWLSSDALLQNQLPYAPLELYQELLQAQKDPGMIVYLPHDPWEKEISPLTDIYWQAARRTVFYENLLQHGTDLAIYRAKHHKNEVLTKAFPVDGTARAKLTRILPYGSKRNRAVKKVLGAMHLR